MRTKDQKTAEHILFHHWIINNQLSIFIEFSIFQFSKNLTPTSYALAVFENWKLVIENCLRPFAYWQITASPLVFLANFAILYV
jgi:hypothetical protein